jgi:hypothetical protein
MAMKEQQILSPGLRNFQLPNMTADLMRKTGPKSVGVCPCIPNVLRNPPISEGGQADTATAFNSSAARELEEIINTFAKSSNSLRREYGEDLLQSVMALQRVEVQKKNNRATINAQLLSRAISMAHAIVNERFQLLQNALEHGDSRVCWLKLGGLWPSVTPISLLEKLRSISKCDFGQGMKQSLVTYALSITALQRLLRIEDAFQNRKSQMTDEEEENSGHENWNPAENLDWLLLEIDANILIRKSQIDVCNATVQPTSRSNSVLQMNMGQGQYILLNLGVLTVLM